MTKIRAHVRHAASGDSFKMAVAADTAVVVAGGAAVSANWWAPVAAQMPHILQGLILVGTVVFVIARAANEVVKFIRSARDKDDSN